MSADTTPNIVPVSPAEERMLTDWVFSDRESMEQRFGMEMSKIIALYNSDEGKKQLLEKMKQMDPQLNGDVSRAADLVQENIEQLEHKKSFLAKVMHLPIDAVQGIGKAGQFLWNHKLLALAAVGVAAWQLPNLMRLLASIEGFEAGNALAKSGEYLGSFLPFSVGKTGAIADSALGPLPGTL
jgi:hypothetical protein